MPLAAGTIPNRTALVGLLDVLLQTALQRSNLLHQTLLKLALIDPNRRRLLRLAITRLLVDIAQRGCHQTSVATFLGRSFRARWLAGTFTLSDFLLLAQIAHRLVDELVVALRSAADLLDEVGETLHVLAGRVLHCRLRLHDPEGSPAWCCLATVILLLHFCVVWKRLCVQEDLAGVRRLVMLLLVPLLLG